MRNGLVGLVAWFGNSWKFVQFVADGLSGFFQESFFCTEGNEGKEEEGFFSHEGHEFSRISQRREGGFESAKICAICG